jgi:membrane protease YdiL (CAAX protease family)
MFKKYLRIQPALVQLLIFLTFWLVLIVLSWYLTQLYIIAAAHISAADFPVFIEHDMFKHPEMVFVSNTLFQVFGFLLPAVIYAYLADPAPVAYLGGAPAGKKIQPVLVVILAVSLIFFIAPLGQWFKQLDLGSSAKTLDDQRDKFIQSYLVQADTWSKIRSLFLIAVIPAFCEEIFFRGILMKFTKSIFKKWWLSIGISALVFALFHATISELLPIFMAGIIIGYVYYLTSSLWMSILLHLIFNGFQAVTGMWSNQQLDKALEQPSSLVIIFAIATSIVVVCMVLLAKFRTPLPDSWSIVVPEIKEPEWDLNQDEE